MTDDGPVIVSLAAPSGTGKTTLAVAVVERLTAAGLRVGVVKHHGHRMELDEEGKDTWKLRRAGATSALLVADNQVAWLSEHGNPPPAADLIALFYPAGAVDVVLVEGFRSAGLPTIVVERSGVEDADWVEPAGPILGRVGPDEVDRVCRLVTDQVRSTRP